MICTSYYGGLRKLPPDVTPVCISVGRPRFFIGHSYPQLAPTREMLNAYKAGGGIGAYNAAFDVILAQLDPVIVAHDLLELAPRVCLLCWEAPGLSCHRRKVAEWLEQGLGIQVPEFGFSRSETAAYAVSPEK